MIGLLHVRRKIFSFSESFQFSLVSDISELVLKWYHWGTSMLVRQNRTEQNSILILLRYIYRTALGITKKSKHCAYITSLTPKPRYWHKKDFLINSFIFSLFRRKESNYMLQEVTTNYLLNTKVDNGMFVRYRAYRYVYLFACCFSAHGIELKNATRHISAKCWSRPFNHSKDLSLNRSRIHVDQIQGYI